MCLKQFKQCKVPAVVVDVMEVSVLTCCALLHSMWDLKAAQMNLQHSLILEFLLYKLKQKQPKTISCVKGEGADISRNFT